MTGPTRATGTGSGGNRKHRGWGRVPVPAEDVPVAILSSYDKVNDSPYIKALLGERC